ncbi:neutral/alkaline non-lysosomal ceramidase N-terminal domain-containing protein [Erwiniaceae bacterium L1_54_6]|nr:neutral/alkaline non-lysosomal ceramidase N-terminal domain-containing protein [Erwiniaceae bacterium L1_54_6]
MKKKMLWNLVLTGAFVLAAGQSIAQVAQSGPLTVGAVKTDITPKNLHDMNPMGGDFTGVHDPIHMRTVLINNGSVEVALISLDAIEVGDMTKVRQRIATETGIPADHVFITATHDHSAPRVGNVSPGALAHDGTPASNQWSEWLYQQMIASLQKAKSRAQPARFGVASGQLDINVNRDRYSAKGWDIGFNANGPSDKTLWVMKFATPAGKPIAVVSNYAVHSVVSLGINQVSGDLAGAAADYVEKKLGGDVVSLWTLSTVGDQNPRIFNAGQKAGRGNDAEFAWKAVNAQGAMAGDEIVRVADSIRQMTSSVSLTASERVVGCPMRTGAPDMGNMNQKKVDKVNLHLGLIMLNQTALAGVSGEMVTEIGRHLTEQAPVKNLLLMSIVNDRVGYLPDDAAYDRPIFEVQGSPVERGCAENAIIDNFTAMMNNALATR